MQLRCLMFLAIVATGSCAWAQRAPAVAMITDVQGAVSIVRDGGPLAPTLAAEIPASSRIELKEGATLAVLLMASGDELVLTGPAVAEVKAGGIEATPRERVARKTTRIGPVKVREGGLTQAAIVMRAPSIERVSLRNLSNTATLDTRPTFRWAPVEGVGPYRFELTDEAGKVLHEARTEATELSLPAGVALIPGRAYTWEVSARRPDGQRFVTFADFSVAPEATRTQANALRPESNAPVSSWTAYALWLDGQGLVDDARAAWQRVAAQRPDDPMVKRLAQP